MRRAYRPKAPDEIARNMSAIRSKENRTESALRKAIHAHGLRYRKYKAGLVGKPDIVFPRERLVVFVDGDYWHGRLLREAGLEALRGYYTQRQQSYWLTKIGRNVERDDFVTRSLNEAGWAVLRFWESDVKADVAGHALLVVREVRRKRKKLG